MWFDAGKRTPKPHPTGTPKGGDGGPTGDPGQPGLGDPITWLTHHPIAIPILLIAAMIGIGYLWKQLRAKQASRGVAVRPLTPILRDLIRFAFKEDKRPLHPKIAWLTGRRAYALLLVAVIAGTVLHVPQLIFAGPALVIVLWARANKVFKARRSIIMQMFAVATGECRYPKGAEMQPWGYINVQNWIDLITPGTTIVTIPAAYQSEDLKTREKFERQFNGTVSEANAWTYKWESAKNRIVCQPAAHLPAMAPYPGPGEKWDEIPVGIGTDGQPVSIPLSMTPHVLVCGPTGTGKSVLQRNILFHALAHSDTWKIVGIDMKMVEMQWLSKYPSVLKVATDLEEATEVLRSLRDEMMRRYDEMRTYGVNHAKDLPVPPPAIMCMIDESTVLLAPEGIKSDEGKERDALHAEAGMIIGELGRLSRASMIHVIACFQRPDANFLRGETKANFDCRIAAGRMDTVPSLMVLDSEAANRLPSIKGRGMIRIGGELDTFQGFFAEQNWFDGWLAAQSGGVGAADPGDRPPGSPENLAESGSAAGGRKRRGGLLKGIAEKAAARSASMEASAAVDADERGDAEPGEVSRPEGVSPHDGGVDVLEVDSLASEPPLSVAEGDEFRPVEEDDNEDFDDSDYPSEDALPVASEAAPSSVVPAMVPTQAGDRAEGPRPASKPAGLQAYTFGSSPAADPPLERQTPEDEEVQQPVSQAPAGLPTGRPAGLPLRPPNGS